VGPPAACKPSGAEVGENGFQQAEENGRLAAEAFFRCRRFVDGWLAHADSVTGLIPRNLDEHRDLWNGRDGGSGQLSVYGVDVRAD